MHDSRPDPSQVHTLAEWLQALRALAGERSYAALDKAANPDKRPGEGLPKTTLSDLFNDGRPSVQTMERLLRACQVPREEWAGWQQARERVLSESEQGTAGLIRVAQADPRRLGVHAAIDAPGATGDLPDYAERDTDTAPAGVRALITKAAGGRGGLVVLVGGSSVGKTRCAYEAVRNLLPHWWLLHPADADQVRAIAADPPARLVVWLDELQRYLDGTNALHVGTVRALLERGAVLVATLWPDRYDTYTTAPPQGGPEPHGNARELLGLADVVDISGSFTAAERTRASQIAEQGDARIALALQAADYGLTQTIAAAPQLMRRWKQADAYAAAVLTAAIDATRLGATSPLPAALLRQAAPGYCDARQRAKAPANWFETALAYLTEELHGAAAVLAPITAPGEGMGQITGYLVADYLQQHAEAERRQAKVPAICWQSLLDHLTDPNEQTRVGYAARQRMLYRYAEPFYRNASQAGDRYAASQLVNLLAVRGQVEEAVEILRAEADAGDGSAAWQLADLLAEEGQADEAVEIFHALADAGDGLAAQQLADLLAMRGQVEELRARADAGDGSAARRLADLLAVRGQVEEAVEILRTLADAGDGIAARQLADLLAMRGQLEELRALTDAGDETAAWRLAQLLAARGQVEELRARADAGDGSAAWWLVELLAVRGQVEEAVEILRALADAGDETAARRLAEGGQVEEAVEELRALADAGDGSAARRLADLLAERGQVEEAVEVLRAQVDAGDGFAAGLLVSLLRSRGRVEEAERLRRYGLEEE